MRKIALMASMIFIAVATVCFALDAPLNLRLSNVLPPVDNPLPYFNQNFQVPRGVSRSAGVAPLSVHFTAGFNASSATDRGFHNFEYSWDFGDPNSGNWGTNGRSKNTAKGPVAAHVYETPGIYKAILVIRDASGVVNVDSFDITVTDPDVVYSGTNTTCISDATQNSFTGCPTGATRVATNDISRIASYIGTGRRVLLQRGSSWTSSGINMPNGSGPVTIGAYGAGSNPNELGIYSNAPRITLTAGNFLNLSNKQDWRICDISFTGSAGGVFGGVTNLRSILMLRLKAEGFGVPVGASHWKEYASDLIDHIMLISSELSGASNNCVYIGSERLAILGNKIYNASESHVVRVWQAYLGVISNNLISGSSLTTTDGRHALKFHGPKESEVNANGTGIVLNHRTAFSVVSGNVFGSSGPWPVAIGPQDAGSDERLTDIIFEKNRIHPDYGTQSSRGVQVALLTWGRYFSVRNNIIDGTGADNYFNAINITQRGVEPAPLGIEVYNNVIYRGNANSTDHTGIIVGNTASRTIIRNNVVSFPAVTGAKILIQNNSPDLIASNNVLTNSPGFLDANIANPINRDFHLRETSSLIGAGTSVPVFDDCDGNSMLNYNYSIGAYRFANQ